MIQIVTKGYFKVVVDGQVISQHSKQEKAVEAALNHKGVVEILFPDKILLTGLETSGPATGTLKSIDEQ